MIAFILAKFGYAKVPIEAVQLAMKLSDDLYILGVDNAMYRSAKALEDLLRSCRKI